MSRHSSALFRTLSTINYLDTKLIRPSQSQLRDQLGDLDELVESIKKNGLLQPIVVRPRSTYFEVVAGNRRLAACRRVRLPRILCVLKELSDKEAYEIALVENLQRRTLNPVESARAFKDYCDKFGYGSMTELAEKIGKSEAYVSHRILLLSLPKRVLEDVSRLELSPTVAEELVWTKDPQKQVSLAAAAVREKLSAKRIRMLARLTLASKPGGAEPAREVHYDWTDLEQDRAETGHESVRVVNEAVLIFRSALIQLDSLVERVAARDPIRDMLMAKRYGLHQLLDDLLPVRKGRMKTVKAFAI